MLGLAGCGGDPEARDGGWASFAESTSQAYEIGPLGARLGQLDERVSFGSIADILATPNGYFVADGLDPRIVLLDRKLDPVRIIGREGEGPGEYRFPSRLVRADDRILVLDGGNGRVAYLTLDGDFVTSQPLPGIASDVAAHPELGLLVAGDAFPGHYLARVTAEGTTAFGPIPEELRVDTSGFRWPLDLVTVTTDGAIHVLDADQLALVSFRPDGDLASVAFLPREMRARELRLAEERVEALGGPDRVIGTQIVSTLRSLEDGRVFVRNTSENPSGVIAKGLVLDMERLEAIPLTFAAGREDPEWRRGSRVYLDGLDRVVLREPLGSVGLAAAQVELVTRDP
ncbi:6-bladed beta-propeller [Candidatus Palauibacter irciniicola]|uniref:6-bladed beta-propeller n=1 Tax=Candidatus Palauibacter irciniicola TaxID=3056733 RepID=UPI003B01BB74